MNDFQFLRIRPFLSNTSYDLNVSINEFLNVSRIYFLTTLTATKSSSNCFTSSIYNTFSYKVFLKWMFEE